VKKKTQHCQIYFHEVSLADGFDAVRASKRADWLVKGRTVERASGYRMFSAMEGTPIKCWCCGIEADRWIVEKHPKDLVGRPTLNLYASGPTGVVLMTRDHIIPKSLGGIDDNANLRPGCTDCNGHRGNEITDEDIEFAKAHPELIDKGRIEAGLRNMRNSVDPLQETADRALGEIERLQRPFKLMGYL
jgi:hypothetical protein